MAMNIFDESKIREAISVLKPNGELFEIRILSNSGKKNWSGYFTSADDLIAALSNDYTLQLDLESAQVYIVLNSINTACYQREQHDRFVVNSKNSTSDNDITGYSWFFIDLDPKRPAGVSSSNDELEKAKQKAGGVYNYLRSLGFNEPVIAMSGNGVHLLYRIGLKNTEENKKLIEQCLKSISMLFSDDSIDVDQKVFNPARICKLYGTWARKGIDSEDRPHRLSEIRNIPIVKKNDISLLKKLADKLPKEETPQEYNRYHPKSFNVEDFMRNHGIEYRESSWTGGKKYILKECPFDSNHNGKDAAIFVSANGAIGFHCFHNSCADKTWKDVRIKYEPTAYEKRNQEYQKTLFTPNRNHVQENDEDRKVFLSAKDIYEMKIPDAEFVQSGITLIDKKMRGLKKGYVSLISGLRASGKSSIISQICLDAVSAGFNVAVFSGELTPKNFADWMNLQAAGKAYTLPTDYENYYVIRNETKEKIANWLADHFWLFNNEYGNNFDEVIGLFEKKIKESNLDLLILDNLMAFDIRTLSDREYEAQTQFVLRIQRIAKKNNVHVMFVAHPRKANGFLRLQDVSGTNNLVQAVDNAFIIHRNNQDFKRLSSEMFGWKQDNEIYLASNVIEIAKDRDGGIQDFFIPLFYEVETKRLKNSKEENKIYNWVDEFVPVTLQDDLSPF